MARNRPLTPSRRGFVSAALVGLAPKSERRIEGAILDGLVPLGHQIRDRQAHANPGETRRIPLVIVGAGIAGLSAAWRLDKRGMKDFVVLEMLSRAGGNSRWGENEVSAYPIAAHYLPVPDSRSALVHELGKDLGLYQGGHWDERWLCHSPQERLFLHGRWQESLEPYVASTAGDRQQYQRFEERIQEFRASGRFTIPMEEGLARSTAAEQELDRITLTDWLRREKFDSPYLNWYLDYCCRDDYGVSASGCSAWAGLHYHAARAPEEKGPLTWPEGNGWIVKRLLERLGKYVHTDSPAIWMEQIPRGWRITTPRIVWEAERIIFAAPVFLASFLMTPAQPKWPIAYSPWLVANLTLDRWPAERGSEPAWDNVIYDSPGLGYVVATHQNLSSRPDRAPTVWTYYHAFGTGKPADARLLLRDKDWSHWKEFVLADLERAHPDIRRCVKRLDVYRDGHAMARPAPGVIFHPERKRRAALDGRLIYAHADLSGFSIFEEAQYRGVLAADRVLR